MDDRNTQRATETDLAERRLRQWADLSAREHAPAPFAGQTSMRRMSMSSTTSPRTARAVPILSLAAVVALVAMVVGIGFASLNRVPLQGSPVSSKGAPSSSYSPAGSPWPTLSPAPTWPGAAWPGGWPLSFGLIDAQHAWVWRGSQDLVMTSDGGATWWAATPPGLRSFVPSPQFIDASHAWILGEAQSGESQPHDLLLWRTDDQGRTWQSTRVPGEGSSPAKADIVSSSLGFVAVQNGFSAVTPVADPRVDIYRTDDGGATVTRAGGLALDQHDLLVGLAFSNGSDGLLTTTDSTTMGADAVRITHDGGATWSKIDLSVPDYPASKWTLSYSPRHVGSDLWVVGYADIVSTASQEIFLLKSRDGGRTWQRVASPKPVEGILAADSTQDINIIGPSTVSLMFGTGSSETVWRTTDAGMTWTKVTPSAPAPTVFVHWSTIDGLTGWSEVGSDCTAVANAPCPSSAVQGLSVTHDGGRTWTVVVPASEYAPGVAIP